MNVDMVKKGIFDLRRSVVHNSPTILTYFAVGGIVSSIALAIAATPKALRHIDEAAYNKLDKDEYIGWNEGHHVANFGKIDVLKAVWKDYIPTFVAAGFTIACVIGSNEINMRKNAAILGVYSLTETAFKEYKEKVKETIGEKKESAIEDSITSDQLKKNPVKDSTVIVTNGGTTLCYESLSGRYFYSTVEAIEKAQNKFNRALMLEMYMTLNELYDELELEHTDLGKAMGWDANTGLVDFKFEAKLDAYDRPCLVLKYVIGPHSL